MGIRIAFVTENIYDSLLVSSVLAKKDFEVCHLLTTSSNLAKVLETSVPDVLMIAIGENAQREVGIFEKLRSQNPKIGLIIISTTPDLRLLGITEQKLPLGVQIILRPAVTNLHILSRAIYDSVDEEVIGLAPQWVVGNPYTDNSKFHSNLRDLTQVQIETLRLIAMGRSNAEIANVRSVTEKAVEHTITRLLVALDIKSDPRDNARVILTREYFRWVEAPRVSA